MIDPHLAADLKRAERTFRKCGQPALAKSAHVLRGCLADTMHLDHNLEGNCQNVINLAFGGPIRA